MLKPKCHFSNLNGRKKKRGGCCALWCSLFQNEGPPSLCKVRATSQCATSPTTGEVLSLASCYKRDVAFQNWTFGRKGGRCCAAASKMKDHLLFAKFVLQNSCATSPSVDEVRRWCSLRLMWRMVNGSDGKRVLGLALCHFSKWKTKQNNRKSIDNKHVVKRVLGLALCHCSNSIVCCKSSVVLVEVLVDVLVEVLVDVVLDVRVEVLVHVGLDVVLVAVLVEVLGDVVLDVLVEVLVDVLVEVLVDVLVDVLVEVLVDVVRCDGQDILEVKEWRSWSCGLWVLG